MTTTTMTKVSALELGAEGRAQGGAGAKRWAGRVLSGLAILFLAFDAMAKVLELPQVMKATAEMGFPTSSVFGIGVTLLVCVILYAIPRTSVLGAVLLTGYLGGAVCANVLVSRPLFTNALFPVYFGIVIWAGLALRDPRPLAMLGIGPRRDAEAH